MSFEKPKYNKPEKEAERKMPKVELEQLLGDMDNYVVGLRQILNEKQKELKRAKIDSEKAEKLKAEIKELETEIEGLSEFSQEGKEEGAEVFKRN